LYKGRGIEIIEEMAKARPHVLFLVIGGNETELNAFRLNNTCKNLMFMGHVPHHVALKTMRCVDILLMPYQRSVSLGVGAYDTARWMSPMKMFEYMASGVPIISSDLPVLREVLKDGVNALLVPPDEAGKWIDALDRLMKDEELSRTTGIQAHMDYKRNYTWTRRAKKLLNFQKLFIK
jgi:glycosyltransferase involved in cell wall biosynthesis